MSRAAGKLSNWTAGSTGQGQIHVTTMPLSFVSAERGAKEWQIAQRDEN